MGFRYNPFSLIYSLLLKDLSFDFYLSKNIKKKKKKKKKKIPGEIFKFYSRQQSLYIAWAYFRNDCLKEKIFGTRYASQ